MRTLTAVDAFLVGYAFPVVTVFDTVGGASSGDPHIRMMPAFSGRGSLALLVRGRFANGLALRLLRPTTGAAAAY